MLIEFPSSSEGNRMIINTDRITSVYKRSDRYTVIRSNDDESVVDMSFDKVKKVLHHWSNDGILKAEDYV